MTDNLDELGDPKTREPLYYSLVPFYGRTDGIATAALVCCIATGRTLDGMGGPGYALAPEIVAGLDMKKSGGKSRVIVDAEKWDKVLLTLSVVANTLAFGNSTDLVRLRHDVEETLEKARSSE